MVLEGHVFKSVGGVLIVLAGLATASTQLSAQDDFPIVGTYTENRACAGASPAFCV